MTNSVNGLIFTQAKGKRILNRSVSKKRKKPTERGIMTLGNRKNSKEGKPLFRREKDAGKSSAVKKRTLHCLFLPIPSCGRRCTARTQAVRLNSRAACTHASSLPARFANLPLPPAPCFRPAYNPCSTLLHKKTQNLLSGTFYSGKNVLYYRGMCPHYTLCWNRRNQFDAILQGS